VGAKSTAELIGLPAVGPNINGVTENPVVPTDGTHRGTIAGVYGDTGIFYSTDPDTAWGSWTSYTGATDDFCGLDDFLPAGYTGETITNNSGDTFIPCNKWDAEQMYAWGVKGTSYTGAGASSSPIVDYGDGRGNAPWGFASGVAGPQSGYAWDFNWDEGLQGVSKSNGTLALHSPATGEGFYVGLKTLPSVDVMDPFLQGGVEGGVIC